MEYGLTPTFYEFNEFTVQFSYVVMFSAAIPPCGILPYDLCSFPLSMNTAPIRLFTQPLKRSGFTLT